MSTALQSSESPSFLASDGDFDGPSQDLWQQLRDACKECQEQLSALMTDNDGVDAPEEILSPSFIKSRLSNNCWSSEFSLLIASFFS